MNGEWMMAGAGQSVLCCCTTAHRVIFIFIFRLQGVSSLALWRALALSLFEPNIIWSGQRIIISEWTGRPCLFHRKNRSFYSSNIVTSDRRMRIAKFEICHASAPPPKIIHHSRETIVYVILGPFWMVFPAPTIFHIFIYTRNIISFIYIHLLKMQYSAMERIFHAIFSGEWKWVW